jgi:hypothetical protein
MIWLIGWNNTRWANCGKAMYWAEDRSMVEVIVFAEGQTEEQFIKRVIAPVLRPSQVFVKPQLLKTSSDKAGGAVSFDRLKFNAGNTLKQNKNVVLSTFLDLYGLDTSFPDFDASTKKAEIYSRTACLEEALHNAIVQQVGCRPERFIPHIQPYEFEGLLFSDVNALCQIEPQWTSYTKKLTDIRDAFETPEHINNSYETKPSKRLENLLHPKYKKTLHGYRGAESITLPVIEQQCPHFHQWMEKLRALAQLQS